MPTRERQIDRGRRLAEAERRAVGGEIRTARLTLGRSLDVVGQAAGLSASQVSRIERAKLETVSIDQLARIGATIGLDIRVHTYPSAAPVRDAAQLGILNRLRPRVHQRCPIRQEVPLPIPGDQRAWDGMIGRLVGVAAVLPVECESRIVDVQAQFRRISLKLRDSGLEHVLVVVADTRRNRLALRVGATMLAADFPISQRSALVALAEGRHPGGSAIVLL